MRAPSLLLLLLALPVMAGAEPLVVSVTPSQVVLGRDPAVRVRVTVPPDAPPPRAAASTGQLQPLPSSEPGVVEYQWTPPDIRYPQRALLAFWTQAPEGPPQVTSVFIPLLGRTTVEVETAVGAQVTVQVADTTFGPVRANNKGRARVPVDVPPGVREAQVLVTRKRLQKRSITRFDEPPASPLLALIDPEPLPAGGPGWLLVLGERPLLGSELNLRVRGGSVEEATPGVFRLTPEPGAKELRVEARRRDGTGLAQAGVLVEAVPPIVVPLPRLVLPPRTLPVAVRPVKPSPAPQPPASRGLHLSCVLLAGGSFAGGDNRGPLGSLSVGAVLPPLDGRVSVELEAGVRGFTSHPRVEPLGPVDSRVVALPVLLAVSVRVFEHGPLAVHGRAGGGVAYYDHRATSSFFDTPLTERGGTAMGFLAAQASWSFGPVSALLELRGSYAPLRTPLINAQLGGLSASVGVRYVL